MKRLPFLDYPIRDAAGPAMDTNTILVCFFTILRPDTRIKAGWGYGWFRRASPSRTA